MKAEYSIKQKGARIWALVETSTGNVVATRNSVAECKAFAARMEMEVAK